MDITSENFADSLPLLRERLDNAEFISLDLEMTGIRLPNEARRPGHLYTDLLPTLYQRYREVVLTFDIMQIGVCCFGKNAEKKDSHNYDCDSFNFYVLRRAIENYQKPLVTLDPETMVFHAKNHFDFQTWLSSGIGCCIADVESAVFDQLKREQYEREQKDKANAQQGNQGIQKTVDQKPGDAVVLTRPEDLSWYASLWADKVQPFLSAAADIKKMDTPPTATTTNTQQKPEKAFDISAMIRNSVREALQAQEKPSASVANGHAVANGKEQEAVSGNDAEQQLLFKDKDPNALDLPNMNGFRAKYLRQQIERLFPDAYVLAYQSKENSMDTCRRLFRSFSTEERKAAEAWRVKQEEEKVRARRKDLEINRVGFRRVWNMLKATEKPLVFHNGMYDLLFLFHNLECPLPETFVQFLAEWHKRIPNAIIDTKVPSEHYLLPKYVGELPLSSLEECITLMDSKYPQLEKTTHIRENTTSKNDGAGADAGSGTGVVVPTKYHDAGFDALQTGRLYIALRDYEKYEFTKNIVPLGGQNLFRLVLYPARNHVEIEKSNSNPSDEENGQNQVSALAPLSDSVLRQPKFIKESHTAFVLCDIAGPKLDQGVMKKYLRGTTVGSNVASTNVASNGEASSQKNKGIKGGGAGKETVTVETSIVEMKGEKNGQTSNSSDDHSEERVIPELTPEQRSATVNAFTHFRWLTESAALVVFDTEQLVLVPGDKDSAEKVNPALLFHALLQKVKEECKPRHAFRIESLAEYLKHVPSLVKSIPLEAQKMEVRVPQKHQTMPAPFRTEDHPALKRQKVAGA
ncbi:unnamed protein product [Amoebophrya sp. A25]|nr:unnamed protein product [Amoebophrya sp. A25]|eukprot:GSA25T00003864001.1